MSTRKELYEKLVHPDLQVQIDVGKAQDLLIEIEEFMASAIGKKEPS